MTGTEQSQFKQCTLCLKPKPRGLRFFHRNRAKPDGLTDWCKDCARAKWQEYSAQRRQSIEFAMSSQNMLVLLKPEEHEYISLRLIPLEHGLREHYITLNQRHRGSMTAFWLRKLVSGQGCEIKRLKASLSRNYELGAKTKARPGNDTEHDLAADPYFVTYSPNPTDVPPSGLSVLSNPANMELPECLVHLRTVIDYIAERKPSQVHVTSVKNVINTLLVLSTPPEQREKYQALEVEIVSEAEIFAQLLTDVIQSGMPDPASLTLSNPLGVDQLVQAAQNSYDAAGGVDGLGVSGRAGDRVEGGEVGDRTDLSDKSYREVIDLFLTEATAPTDSRRDYIALAELYDAFKEYCADHMVLPCIRSALRKHLEATDLSFRKVRGVWTLENRVLLSQNDTTV